MGRIYKSAAGQQAVETMYRHALDRWPVPHRDQIVPTSQGDTFVVVSGPDGAPPVVLLHGSGANSAIWMRDIPEWSQHFLVHAVDLIGEPGFSAPSRPPFRSEAYVRWLDEVLDGLRLTAASFVGISLGGWLALEYAVKQPMRVASLSLVSPSGVGSQKVAFLMKVALLRLCGDRGLRTSIRLLAGDTSVPAEVSQFIALVFRHFIPRMDRLPRRTDEELSRLAVPVQLILGGRDPMLRSIETRDRMQRLVPHVHLTYLEGEGHILPRQTGAIGEFLRTAGIARPARVSGVVEVPAAPGLR